MDNLNIAVKELENRLKEIDDISYKSIDSLMRNIMKKFKVTAKQLHYAFVNKHNETPDDWIKSFNNWNDAHKYIKKEAKNKKRMEASNSKTTSEETKVIRGVLRGKDSQIARSSGAGALTPSAAQQLGKKAVELRRKKQSQVDIPKFLQKEDKLVDKIVKELLDEKCWTGYKRKKGTKKFSPGSCIKKEDVSIEDANGNTFAEVIDIIKPEPIKGFKSKVNESKRLQSQIGNIISTTLTWRGKYYGLKMFFPQIKFPTRKEIEYEIQKIYPGAKVYHYSISEIESGKPLIQPFEPRGGSLSKFGPNKNYIKPMGESVTTIKKEVKKDLEIPPKSKKELLNKSKKAAKRIDSNIDGIIDKKDSNVGPYGAFIPSVDGKGKLYTSLNVKNESVDKDKMKCNSPKAQPHGSGESGKSHIVKACDGGKEKIIRFGQLGVKGSPKKEGESKEYANRRKRFKSRHAKNIAKGKMSAAYWSSVAKW